MPKYYIVLLNRATNQMHVPVKAALNPYEGGTPAYCGEMPQFFGGTDSDGQPPPAVLDQEIGQESRRTLELTSPSPRHLYTEASMFFYWAAEDQWQQTGNAWGPAGGPAEAEMDRIVTVDLTRFDNLMNDDAIINELVTQTGSAQAPRQAVQDFNASATRTAFISLIRMHLTNQL